MGRAVAFKNEAARSGAGSGIATCSRYCRARKMQIELVYPARALHFSKGGRSCLNPYWRVSVLVWTNAMGNRAAVALGMALAFAAGAITLDLPLAQIDRPSATVENPAVV